MDNQKPSKRDNLPLPSSRNPQPVTVPRSQFASHVRFSNHQYHADNSGPRYFSSPYRAPPKQQDRHEAFVEHHRSTSNAHNVGQSLPRPQYVRDLERTSYAFFEPQHELESLSATKKSGQALSVDEGASNASHSPYDQHGVVRQASIGHRARPALFEVRRSDSSPAVKPPKTPPPQPGTLEALNAAITAASKELAKESYRPHMSKQYNDTRALVDSPSSTYSEDHQHPRRSVVKPLNLKTSSGKVSPLMEGSQAAMNHDTKPPSPLPDPRSHSEKSSSSTNPLLGLGIQQTNMNDRVPEELRPPRLNMKGIQDHESRASITSLPDLIRRATRLAANLDRGRTASRLGMWDMFNNTDHGNTRRRESTFSDVLNSFPDPATGTPAGQFKHNQGWPDDSKRAIEVTEKEEREAVKERGTCCGLSVTMFIIVLVIIILLIAASVLIPIFLVVIPRQQHSSVTSLSNCAATQPCQNNGISMIDDNSCSCVCVDGFTGSDCSKPTDPNCVVADITQGSWTYNNATVGSTIVSLMTADQSKLGVAVNNSVLLSVFARNNYSCASENSLVSFYADKQRNAPRLVIVPGLEPDYHLEHDATTPVVAPSTSTTQAVGDLQMRQATIMTSFNVIYQATSTQVSVTPSVTLQPVNTATSAASSSSLVLSPSSNVTMMQIQFAQMVVLHVLGETRSTSTAVLAQQKMEQYFRAGVSTGGNSTIALVRVGDTDISVDFARLTLITSRDK